MKKLLILAVVLLAFSGCNTRDSYFDEPPMLKLIVTTPSGSPLVDAEVMLFDNRYDYEDLYAPVRVGYTNNRGEVFFDNLDELVYYFDVYLYDSYYDIEFSNIDGVNYTQYRLRYGDYAKINVRTKIF